MPDRSHVTRVARRRARRTSRAVRALALVVGVGLALSACSPSDQRPTLEGPTLIPETTSTTSSITTAVPTTTTTPLPKGASWVATVAVRHIGIYQLPGAALPVRTFDSPWLYANNAKAPVDLVFRVLERRPKWVKVLLPVRPNGSTGWVRESDVHLGVNTYQVFVQLGAHTITVKKLGATIYDGPIAIGKPSTPTPTGSYYILVLIQAPNPHTVYGPFAYGLSSHSDVLTSFAGGDGEIGIHGNDDISVLGHDITHGCIRMDNGAIARLAGLLPLGTPVEITP
jgi:lipoprotein-anchoring transpeptidase ErfK/SrfK